MYFLFRNVYLELIFPVTVLLIMVFYEKKVTELVLCYISHCHICFIQHMFWGKSYTVFGDSHIHCVPISGITEVEDIFPASVVVAAFHDLQVFHSIQPMLLYCGIRNLSLL